MNKCIYCGSNINDGLRGAPNKSGLCTRCQQKRAHYRYKFKLKEKNAKTKERRTKERRLFIVR